MLHKTIHTTVYKTIYNELWYTKPFIQWDTKPYTMSDGIQNHSNDDKPPKPPNARWAMSHRLPIVRSTKICRHVSIRTKSIAWWLVRCVFYLVFEFTRFWEKADGVYLFLVNAPIFLYRPIVFSITYILFVKERVPTWHIEVCIRHDLSVSSSCCASWMFKGDTQPLPHISSYISGDYF